MLVTCKIALAIATAAFSAVSATSAGSTPATMPNVPAIDGKTSYMATPENFAGITGNGIGANANGRKSNLPAETHLAWLEYLANAYIQCDDFVHAREIVSEMYVWLVEPQRLRRNVSDAIQIIQRRIDERHECLMSQYGPGGACKRDGNSLAALGPAPDKGLDGAAMAQVMERVQVIENSAVTDVEQKQLAMVHRLLRSGFVNSAMQTFHQIAQTARTSVLKQPFGKLEFVLKLVRFDLENPNNCMPLWRTVCCLDWKMKHHILDAFDLMSGRAFHNHKNTAQLTLKQILSRLDDMPLASELKTRLLIADGRVQAWNHLNYLSEPDRFLAQACLTLKGVPHPAELPAMPRMTFGNNSAAAQLDARARAHDILQQGVAASKGAPTRCTEALAELEGLQKSCPYGGFIRVGVFSQVFGDYLFIKCLSLPYTVPAGLPNLPSLEDVALEAKAEVAQSLKAGAVAPAAAPAASTAANAAVGGPMGPGGAFGDSAPTSGAPASGVQPSGAAAGAKDDTAQMMQRIMGMLAQNPALAKSVGGTSWADLAGAVGTRSKSGAPASGVLASMSAPAGVSATGASVATGGAMPQCRAAEHTARVADVLAELAHRLEAQASA